MNQNEIYNLLKARFPNKVLEFDEKTLSPSILVDALALPEIASYLRHTPELYLDSLMCLSGLDYPDRFSVVYHLFSTRHSHKTVIKVNTPKDNPTVPSVAHIWSAANAHEREVYDLLGIEFPGHPNLKRILLPDDWEGHPLRKDYQYPASYHGVPL